MTTLEDKRSYLHIADVLNRDLSFYLHPAELISEDMQNVASDLSEGFQNLEYLLFITPVEYKHTYIML